ncbi:zinc finger protein 644 [Amia ocellicauda]|uniref:zinc finger protein 644 n=1 Tax=Amia ocellicauda TaxID=2972642 RepID=UPI0034641526
MADLKKDANEEKNFDSLCENTSIKQVSLKRQTSSPKNNALSLQEQLSTDTYEKPLNGAQPILFVHSSATAVSTADHTLLTGTVVNGPVPSTTSEKQCVLNKGSVSLSNAQPLEQPAKISSPPVSKTPHELKIPTTSEAQSQAQQEVSGLVPDPLAAQKVASLNQPYEEEEESEAARTSLSEDTTEGTPMMQIMKSEEMNNRKTWHFSLESSDSSSDEYDSAHDLNWDPQKEFMQFLWENNENDLAREAEVAPQPSVQRRRKRKMDMVELEDLSENVWADLNHASKRSRMDDVSDYEESSQNTISNKRLHSFRRKPNTQSSVDLCEKYPSETVEAIKQLILNSPSKKHLDGHNMGEMDSFSCMGSKLKPIKTEPSTGLDGEQEPSFFPCTKCNVNFKEKKHLHRHMMYHLDGNNQFRHVNVPRPFICRECGRSFRDRNSLLKHMIIHQERREKLMEEIKGMNELQDEGRNARLQCPQCVFGTNCPKTFVQHAKTHEKDKRYYCCEECNFMAVTEHELECHRVSAHGANLKPTYIIVQKTDAKGQKKLVAKYDILGSPKKSFTYSCKICPFSTPNKNVLKKHVELIHQQQYHEEGDSPQSDKTNDYAVPEYEQHTVSDKSQKTDARLHLKPKHCMEKQAFRSRTEMPFLSDGLSDLFRKNKSMQKARKGMFNSQLAKWSLSKTTNKLSSLRRHDKQSKLTFQPVEKIDVTTGLPYADDSYSDSEQGYGSMYEVNLEKQNSRSNCYKPLTPKIETSSDVYFPSYDSDQSQEDSDDADSEDMAGSRSLLRTSPNKRKISVPYPEAMDQGSLVVLPKLEQNPKKDDGLENLDEDVPEDTYDFSDYTSEATANFLDCNENEQNPYARNYFIRRQRFPMKEDRGLTSSIFEDSSSVEKDNNAIQKVKVKEECIETEVCAEALESTLATHGDSFANFDMSPFTAERKSCPYCPALFESGVGLSNHVRGHLHRVGLSYDARHVVSPEQVASQDRKPRIRRKITAVRRIKKVDKPDSQTEHTCPLCGGWFDTKTGLSNHVRGHLKRIGKTISSTSKSPVCILNEMMQDKEEYKNILQVLNKKRFFSRPFVSQKFASSDGLFLSPTGIPVKIQHASPDGETWAPAASQQEGEGFGKKLVEAKPAVKSPQSSTLIELLKKKRQDEEMEMSKIRSQTARKRLTASPPKENSVGTQAVKTELNWQPDKNELNKKVCVHCNTTFPSAVSLSNHLRAYARRKRAALLEGTTYDCKQKKPRSRPGPKKKIFPLPHTAEEIYRLTCRFCDLVFQGPLSVQEDWIKHLQRHLMNTSVPRTGAGMVEVTALPKDASSVSEQQTPLLVTQAAS